MFIYSICSSSRGNSTYISNKKSAILIDVGVSISSIYNSLKLAGLNKDIIKAIFITHEHKDHVCGLYSATKELNVPVFSSKPTLKKLILNKNIYKGTKLFEINSRTANISGIMVSAFRVMHDSVDGLRYNVYDEKGKISICTDLGCLNHVVLNRLKDSELVFLEANYDEDMLNTGRYHPVLKRRIASNYGHLSNIDAAKGINFLIEKGVKRFILGHLSEKNNTPQLALKTVVSYLLGEKKHFGKDYELSLAAVKNNGRYYEI